MGRFSGLDCVKQTRASDAQCIPCKKTLPNGTEVNRFRGNCKRDATVLASQIFTPWHVCGDNGACPQGRLPKFRGRVCWAFNKGAFSRYHGPAGVCIKESWHSRHIPTVKYALANMAHGIKNVVDFVAAYQWSMEQRESWGDRPDTVMTCQLFCGVGNQACGRVGDCSCGEACSEEISATSKAEPNTTEAPMPKEPVQEPIDAPEPPAIEQAGLANGDITLTANPEPRVSDEPEATATEVPIHESIDVPGPSTSREMIPANEAEGDNRGEGEEGPASEGDGNQGPELTIVEPESSPKPTPELMATEEPRPSMTAESEPASEARGDERREDEDRYARGFDGEDQGSDPTTDEPEPTPEATELRATEEPVSSTVEPIASLAPRKLIGEKRKCTQGKIRFQRGVGDRSKCLAMCEAEPACKFFTTYNRGGCVIWSRCDHLRYSRAGTTYARF